MPTHVFIAKQMPLEYYDTIQVGIRWLNVLKKYEQKIKADYYRTTETWKEHHPVFHSKIGFAGAEPGLIVFTNDEVYRDIDEGAVRFVTMDKDFIPKTKARVLRSFPGRGGVAYFDPQTPRWTEPRYFSDTITRKYSDAFFAELRRATIKGVQARRAR